MASLASAAALPRLAAAAAAASMVRAPFLSVSLTNIPPQWVAEAASVPDAKALEQQRRHRHSQTQVKRLFKKHPAQIRTRERKGIKPRVMPVPERRFPPAFEPDIILPNGWSSPPSSSEDGFVMPDYPFRVTRTGNKPNGAPGFLPVYSEIRKHNTKHSTIIRKVSGDRDAFLNELRAALNLPVGTNDPIRVRTGGNIEIGGDRVRDVKKWLGGLGF